MSNIDLSRYEIRTDMAIDLLDNKNNTYENENYLNNGVKVNYMRLDENNKVGKNKGSYITLEFDDITDSNNKDTISAVFKEEFKKILDEVKYNHDMKTLIVGLGNINSTPDSLGPKVSKDIIVTKHMFDMKLEVDDKFSNVSSIHPGVTSQTGIETSNIIKAVVDSEKPDIVILIDALASSSISRVNKSIQISTSGISPGSGVGNARKEISSNTLNVPVISVGVPTVVDASVIVSDTINYMSLNYTYNKRLNNKGINKFITKPVNYLKVNRESTISDKKDLLGLLGTLSTDEIRSLTYEVLNPIGYNLMVTPKEVDFLIERLASIISFGINHNLHQI